MGWPNEKEGCASIETQPFSGRLDDDVTKRANEHDLNRFCTRD
jgi:hypothetical protein